MTDDQTEMLDALLDVEAGLTAWELDFIESMEGRRDVALSEKQADCLQRIFDKRVEGSDGR